MKRQRFSRRDMLKASAAAAATVFAAPLRAQAPAAAAITPALIEAARKEGKVVFYTAMDLRLAERFAKAFEAKYPGIAVRVERSGAERVFQRIGQEYASRIHAVDVVNSADAAHFIVWKRNELARALSARGGRAALPEGVLRSRRALRRRPRLALLASATTPAW